VAFWSSQVALSLILSGCSEDASAGGTNGPAGDGGASDAAQVALPSCAEQVTVPCGACTEQGAVSGAVSGTSCEFLGIPYAEPPVGPRRWLPPLPAGDWSGILEAKVFGPACVQGQDLSLSPEKSEDCLTLNVWTPQATSEGALPVMVFIHGGAYVGGAAKPHVGRGLSEAGPVVVVTMNYRLGALGFLAHPALDAERAGAPSGSDGIRDQQLALRWVQDNIAAFQGDPTNVTVFGESAGSSSVGVHHVSPGSKGLARRFILESGVSTSGVENGIEPASRADGHARSEQLAAELCPGAPDVLACLRALPPEQLMLWTPGGLGGRPAWVPVIEGEGGVLPEHPDALIASGKFNRGEVVVGTNRNEFGLFQGTWGKVDTVAAFRADVAERFLPSRTAEILALYEPATDAEASQAQITMMTDVMFRCATREFARAVTAQGESVYLYSFEQGNAIHADELGYVFGPGNYGLDLAGTRPDLSATVQSYWVNFARTGDPNGESAAAWPKFQTAADAHQVLVEPPREGANLQKAECDFWKDYLVEARR
jgi:para-nitrobenzyl esterase